MGKFFMALPESVFDDLFDAMVALSTERNRFFHDEGVLGILMRDDRSHDGTTNAEAAGSHKAPIRWRRRHSS